MTMTQIPLDVIATVPMRGSCDFIDPAMRANELSHLAIAGRKYLDFRMR